jgi:hypothetical protein
MYHFAQPQPNELLHSFNNNGMLQQLSASEKACLAAQIIMADVTQSDDVLHKVISHCDASLYKLIAQQNDLPVF